MTTMRKKMSNRNTRSVIDDIPFSDNTFVDLLYPIVQDYSSVPAGPWRRSIKSIVAFSILNTRSEMLEVR